MPDLTRFFRQLLPVIERRQTSLLVLILIGFGSLFGAMLYELRDNAWRQAMTTSDNLLGSIGREIHRDIDTFERALLTLRAERERADGTPIVFPTIADVLSQNGEFFVIDRDGTIVERSGTSAPAGRDEIAALLSALSSSLSGRLYIGPPLRGEDGKMRLWLAVPVGGNGAALDGAVAVALQLDRWRYVFDQFSIGSMSSINLFHAGGRLTMRTPYVDARIGEDFSGTGNFRRFSSMPAGQFVSTAVIDGVERAYNFARIGDHPLILNVALSTGEIFAAFNASAAVVGAAFVLLVALLGGLAHLLMRELRLRRTSEARYRALSDTDALTGIANRRSFDLSFEREWSKAMRRRFPLSMILVDVDHFKSFNDIYGHPAGDLCLVEVAGAIARAVGPANGTVARYGGEEFVVLLPQTDEGACLALGERIRELVAALPIVHAGNRGVEAVTVSLGVATAVPGSEIAARPSVLVDAADRALYASKRNGRNRVTAEPLVANPSLEAERAEETARLAILSRYEDTIDGEMSSSLSELAAMAAAIFQAPLALVTLMDRDRGLIRFIGRFGTQLEGARIDESFCRHTILGEGLFMSTDPTNDPRFARHPFVMGDPGVRFYAGVPLRVDGDGPAVGSVCVMDTKARGPATPLQAGLLKDLAKAVMGRLEDRALEEERRASQHLRQLKRR